MEASLWVSKTGLDAQQMRMTVISNNLANVNTVGYKRDRPVFEDLLYQNIRQAGGSTGGDNQSPTGLMIGTGVRIVATEKTHTQGSMIQTKNALDLAIQGEGMFQVLQPDGTFAYTGFSPAFVMLKGDVTDTWSDWYIFDNKRKTFNLNDVYLQGNDSAAENGAGDNYAQIDMLSNGFKIRRDSNWGYGDNNLELYYMAFAESPFVTSGGIPTTAR